MATPTTTFFAATGDPIIDATTHGYKWVLNADRGIDWAVSGGFSGEFWLDPNAVAGTVSQALSTFSTYANINFTFVGSGFAHPLAAAAAGSEITVGLGSLSYPFASTSTWGLAFFPDATYNVTQYPGAPGDVYLNVQSAANTLPSFAPGSQGWLLTIHELGHALGLKHPHDDGGTGRPTLNDIGLAGFDIDWFTIMSYNDGNPSLFAYDPATPMLVDVLAMQFLYGKNTSTNAGDTTFTLTRDPLYQTLWDASGVDTVSAAGSNTGWTIQVPNIQLSQLVDTKGGFAYPTSEESLSAFNTLYWLAGDYRKRDRQLFRRRN